MLPGILHFPVPGEVQFTDGRHDLEPGAADDEIEPELVVTLTRAPVAYGRCTLLPGDLHHFFCNERAGKGSPHGVAFVRAVRLYRREDMFPHKPVPYVDGIMAVGHLSAFSGCNVNLFVPLADMHGNRDHAVILVPFLQERDADGGVKPPGICKNYGAFSHDGPPVRVTTLYRLALSGYMFEGATVAFAK